MSQSIQEWTKYSLWKTAFNRFEGVWSPVVARSRNFGKKTNNFTFSNDTLARS